MRMRKSVMFVSSWLAAAVVVVGCDGSGQTSSETTTRAQSEGPGTVFETEASVPALDTCALALSAKWGAGEFVVRERQSRNNDRGDDELTLTLEPSRLWLAPTKSDADAGVVLTLRSSDVILASGGGFEAFASLRVGQRVGLLLDAPADYDGVGAPLGRQWLFSEETEGAGYSNGRLFTHAAMSLDEVGDIFTAQFKEISETGACSSPIEPDYLDGVYGEPRSETQPIDNLVVYPSDFPPECVEDPARCDGGQ